MKNTTIKRRILAAAAALCFLTQAGCTGNKPDKKPSPASDLSEVQINWEGVSSAPSGADTQSDLSEAPSSKSVSSAASSKGESSKKASSTAASKASSTALPQETSSQALPKAESASSSQQQSTSHDAAASAPDERAAPPESSKPQSAEAAETPSQEKLSSEEQSKPERAYDRRLVVIDAGHQSVGNYETEPIGPGSSEMKAKVTGGTSGTTSGVAEYELTLALALKLQTLLEAKGFEVIQVRTSNDVNISNIERAEIANSAGADAFIRIHANGSEDTSVSGAMTICQTPGNPYNGSLYEESRALSECVLDELTAATGCRREYVWETDTMSGINWAQVPVTIVEVGYMSNPQEDLLLAQDDYRGKICEGLAAGIERYLSE